MTFEIVMEIFAALLARRQDIEVVHLKRGCQIFLWKEEEGFYMASGALHETPDGLFRALTDTLRASLPEEEETSRQQTEKQLAECIRRYGAFYKLPPESGKNEKICKKACNMEKTVL